MMKKTLMTSQFLSHHCPVMFDDIPVFKAEKNMAVVISGLETRLLLLSKFKNVVENLAGRGFKVDVYIDVLGSQLKFGDQHSAVENQTSSRDLQETLATIKNFLDGKCGSLGLLNIREAREELDVPSKVHPWGFGGEIGVNVLRRFSSYEFVLGKVRDQEKIGNFKYDFLLLTRDDDEWLGPLQMEPIQATTDKIKHAMFSKNCKQFGGYNDKTLLFGREAADRILGNMFQYAMSHIRELPGRNPESFLKLFVEKQGVEAHEVDFKWMPTTCSSFIKGAEGQIELCQKKSKTCESKGWPVHFCKGS